MKKLIIALTILILSACSALPAASSQPVATPIPTDTYVSPVPGTSTPEPTSTAEPTAIVNSTATETLSAATLEPTQMPLPTLQPGQPIALTNLHMVDTAIGWGIEKSGRIVRTHDGGQTWIDVTPPSFMNNSFSVIYLDVQIWNHHCSKFGKTIENRMFSPTSG
jgi:hypothetical protein